VADMNEFPEFESEDELRDWFEAADLASYALDDALDVVVAAQVRLVVGDEPADAANGSGTTGSLHIERVLTAT
jgi:hypothetical protein